MHVDLPGPDEIERLLAHRGPACVSIYLPTRPDTPDGEQERIGWKNLAADALRLLRSRGVDDREAPRWRALLDAVDSDARFWRYQARTLAAFTDGDAIRTFQLPNRLPELVTVTNRFHVKPLLRSVTFPQACFVLALTQGSVRLWEIGADFGPFEVPVSDLPASADGFLRSAPGGERSPMQRITAMRAKRCASPSSLGRWTAPCVRRCGGSNSRSSWRQRSRSPGSTARSRAFRTLPTRTSPAARNA